MQKKNHTKLWVTCLSIFTFTVLTCVSISIIPRVVQADAVSDLQAKIEETKRLKAQLEQEIAQYAALADKTSAEAKSLQSVIKELTSNSKKLDLDIKKTKTNLNLTTLTIQKTQNEISDIEKTIGTYREGLSQALQSINQYDEVGLIENFLNKRNLSDSLQDIDTIHDLNSEIQSQTSLIRKQKVELGAKKQEEEVKKDELTKIKLELTDKQKAIEYTKKEQASMLANTKNKEQNYQALLKETTAKRDAFDKDLFNYESQLKYTLDPSSLPTEGSSPLAWPTDNVFITQRFGVTNASKRLYVSGSHNGVDFKATIGTAAKALANGTVIGTGDTDLTCKKASFGRWVLIKFDNGLAATYGHLSVISATPGQKVSRGDVIGYSGNTGYSTGPHLHISVYAANAVSVQTLASKSCSGRMYTMPIAATNAYLDPMLYFPAYSK